MGDLTETVRQWWRDNVDGALFGVRWVTLKSGTVVKLDEEGRIVVGGPKNWQGAHVQDVPRLAKKLRELEGTDCALLTRCRKCRATFSTRQHGMKALLDANPELADFLEREWGSDSQAFYLWQQSRKGKKPAPVPGDGRFDALNERWELKGQRRITSWLEAVYTTVPPNKRWDAFDERIEVLEEATGLELRLPDDAERRELQRKSAAECREGIERAIDELVARARKGRLEEEASADDGVPF